MICPHCQKGPYKDWISTRDINYGRNPNSSEKWQDDYVRLDLKYQICHNCEKLVFVSTIYDKATKQETEHIIYPISGLNNLLPPEISSIIFQNLYKRAIRVFNIDSGLSAVAFGRLIEAILKTEVKTAPQKITLGKLLNDADVKSFIQRLDTDLYQNLFKACTARNLGGHANFEIITGDLIEMETSEVEFLKEVVEHLMDLAFVQPAKAAAAKASIIAKSASAKK